MKTTRLYNNLNMSDENYKNGSHKNYDDDIESNIYKLISFKQNLSKLAKIEFPNATKTIPQFLSTLENSFQFQQIIQERKCK